MKAWRNLALAFFAAACALPAQAQPGRGDGDEPGRFKRALAEIQKQISAGDYARAEQQARRMLARLEARGDEQGGGASRLNLLLGSSLHLQGRYDEARPVQVQGLDLCQRHFGDNAAACLRGQIQHADTLQKLGRLAEAEKSIRQALTWADTLPEGRVWLRVLALNQAGQMYGDMGQRKEAVALLERALSLTEGRSEQRLRKTRAGTLFHLGRLFMKWNRLEEAERTLREALRQSVELYGPDSRMAARTRFQLGHALYKLGRAEAVEELRTATGLLLRRAGERAESTLSAMSVLAQALEARGEAAEAESWQRRALAGAREGGLPASQAHFSHRLGRLLAGQNRLQEAVAAYREGVAAAEKLLTQARGLPEELRHGVIGQFLQMYRELIDLLLRLHDAAPAAGHDREAFAVTALTQSRIFSEMLRQAQVSEYARSDRFRALKSQRDRLLDRLAAARRSDEAAAGEEAFSDEDEAAPAGEAAPAPAAPRADLDSALAANEAALWAEFPQYMELVAPRRLEAARIQALLRPGEALLSYALLRERAVLFVLTRERFAAVPLTPGRAAVSSRVRELRAPFEAVAAEGDASGLAKLDPALLNQAHRELFAPAAAHLAGVARLIVIGDGPLYTLPLGMLVERFADEDRQRFAAARAAGPPLGEYAGLAYLGDRYRIGYLPSVAAFVALRGAEGARRRHAEEFVGFADPRFGAPAAAPAPLRGGLAPLPETAEEARRIARLLDGTRTRLLLGEAAQEHAAKQPDLAGARYVLFATHGVLGGEFVEEAEAALRQPALALSMSGDLRGEDGWLTMREVIEQVRLGAELIVLSACNTAGGAGGGEGFAGLTRAFMYAGARGLVVSHWAVESAATRDLMVGLFGRLRAGADAAAALGEAQRALRAVPARAGGDGLSRAHPFFWAPFVLVGD